MSKYMLEGDTVPGCSSLWAFSKQFFSDTV